MPAFFFHERLFKLISLLVACGFMSSCMVSPPTQLDREIINALVIKNETSVALLNVTLRVPEKHKIVKNDTVYLFSNPIAKLLFKILPNTQKKADNCFKSLE